MIKQHTKLFKNFLKKIGMNSIRVRNGKQTECDMFENIIFFSMDWYKSKELKKYENVFAKIYKEKNFDIKISLATFGFFHELGHIFSKIELPNIFYSYRAYLNQIRKLPNNTIENRMRKYKKLRLENLADKYGYLLYKLYEKEAIRLDKKLLTITNKSD
jgi:hypothetical protein